MKRKDSTPNKDYDGFKQVKIIGRGVISLYLPVCVHLPNYSNVMSTMTREWILASVISITSISSWE